MGVAENDIRISNIENNTKKLSEMTGAERKEIEEAIYPTLNGFRAHKGSGNVDYTIWQIGDEVWHIDGVGKTQIVGMVLTLPFDPTTDLENTAKFDLYKNDKPNF